jgi:hypothetical protein
VTTGLWKPSVARVLANSPAVGVVVSNERTSLSIRGHATLLDGLPASPAELARAPWALKTYASRNALEMAAFLRDTVQRRARPGAAAPLSVRIDDLELLKDWPAHAVLGWETPDGPIALPARWNARTSRAIVPAAPLKAVGGPRTTRASVCIDESEGAGPLAKGGELVRGVGRARLRGDVASIALDTDRVTRWKGFEVETVPA